MEKDITRPVESKITPTVGKVVKEIKPTATTKPGVDWDGVETEITTDVLDTPYPDWDEVLTKWGYDPEVYEIVEPVKVSHWQTTNEGNIVDLYSMKAGVRTRSAAKEIDYLDLVREIKRHRPLSKKLPNGEQFFIVNISDTQFGKADGHGLQGTIDYFVEMIDRVDDRIRELRKCGRQIGTLIVAGVGDINEGCDGQYATQTFTVQANSRQQKRIARRLIRDAIARWSKQFNRVIVLAVPGNHGENRKDGKAYTTPGDNSDVEVFEEICDIFAANPDAYGHVEFVLPEDDVYVTLRLGNRNVGWAHGHITGSAPSPQLKLRNWWKEQAFCSTSIGNCDILITGHYHHLSVINYDETKWHLQCPASDGGSNWWRNLTGQHSQTGTLTLIIDDDGPKDISVL